MFVIEFKEDAVQDIRSFRKPERKRILEELETQLLQQPNLESRNRKMLRPNKTAEWELRIDKFRVFYEIDTDEQIVTVVAVGKKEGNRLFIHQKEYRL